MCQNICLTIGIFEYGLQDKTKIIATKKKTPGIVSYVALLIAHNQFIFFKNSNMLYSNLKYILYDYFLNFYLK